MRSRGAAVEAAGATLSWPETEPYVRVPCVASNDYWARWVNRVWLMVALQPHCGQTPAPAHLLFGAGPKEILIFQRIGMVTSYVFFDLRSSFWGWILFPCVSISPSVIPTLKVFPSYGPAVRPHVGYFELMSKSKTLSQAASCRVSSLPFWLHPAFLGSVSILFPGSPSLCSAPFLRYKPTQSHGPEETDLLKHSRETRLTSKEEIDGKFIGCFPG